MCCPTGGGTNDESGDFCKACEGNRASEATQSPSPHIDNHLVWAVLVTIFCCLPFGIVSIVYAAQVNGMVAAGSIDAARQASENAKMWAWISFTVGLVSFGGFGVWALVSGDQLMSAGSPIRQQRTINCDVMS